MNALATSFRTIKHFHLFSGIGGGARGFNRGTARLGHTLAIFRCLGGIDVDAGAIEDFEGRAGVPGTVMDLFDRQQYEEFHGHAPPLDWREMLPHDVLRAAGNEHPNIIFLSAPCKGFSGLLSETRSKSTKYQALNRLTVRGLWLALEAFKDDPAELILFENVPRIANRGRKLLDQMQGMLRAYGYVVAETTHDCGELGGLAQSRKRFLMVARHAAKVPNFVYEPAKKRLRGVGEVLDRMPLPGDERGGPMHRVPSLQWQTWVRLAFVEAGSDWRSLNKLAVRDGMLRDYLLVPEMRGGVLGVSRWDEALGAVAGRSSPTNGKFSVADPRFDASPRWKDGQQYGVLRMDEPAGAIAGQQAPGQGRYSVADPRHHGGPRHNTLFRVVRWDEPGRAITGADGRQQCVADPRTGWPETAHGSKLAVTAFDEPAKTVTGARFGSGALCVADPTWEKQSDGYRTGGHYGVLGWQDTAGAVSAAACHDNGRWAVADPRLPAATDRLVATIISTDGTWHRPFTTLELAALQSLVDPEEYLELQGLNDQAWRERVGNAVPPDSATAMADVFGKALLAAWEGEKFLLSNEPLWVQPMAVALSVAPQLMPEDA